MTVEALIGLGSNLGDRKAILDAAIASLAKVPGVEVRAVSAYHETAPVGGPPGQGPFLNAAAALDCVISAPALHDSLKQIERDAGRVRVVRWGERTLDLDLLLFGDEVIATPSLRVPHPRMGFRRFVLLPASEVAPDARDPLTGRTIQSLLANVDRRPSYLAFHHGFGVPDINAEGLLGRLADALPARVIRSPTIQIGRFSKLGRRSAMLSRTLKAMVRDAAEAIKEIQSEWLVTDYWIEGLCLWAIPRLEQGRAGFSEFLARFDALRGQAPQPTLIVRLGGTGRPVSAWPDRVPSITSDRPSPPVLDLNEADDDRRFDEIIAACRSTRP